MAAIDQIVNVNITVSDQAVQQQSFSIPAIFGSSNRYATAVTTTGTVASPNANQVTITGSTSGIEVGQYVSGTHLLDGSYVVTKVGSVLTLNQSATASGSGITLTFKPSVEAFTSLAGMVEEGFLTSDNEYIHASELLEQPLQPPIFYVGNYFPAVAQQDDITVTAASGHVYTVTIDGTNYSYTSGGGSPTLTTIVDGIVSAINTPATAACLATNETNIVVLDALIAGAGFTVSINANPDMALSHSVINYSITNGIQAAQLMNDSWYGVSVVSQAAGDIEQVAAYIETQFKVYIADSIDAAIATTATDDVGSILKGAAYKRTALMFATTANDGRSCAWLGGQLPQTPGSNNWAFKTLVGIEPDSLTATQQEVCIGVPEAGTAGKNVNIYQTVAGVNITEMGTMAGGQYIDITIGVDWLKSQIQTNVYSALVNSPKIPYTDIGTSVLIQAVKSAIDLGVFNGLIDGNSPITVTAPAVLSVPTNQRINRIAPTITFTCRLAGAFNAVIVNGFVSV